MTPEQHEINRIKEYLKTVATNGIRQTLRNVINELDLLSHLLNTGIEASVAEMHAACNSINVIDPGSARKRTESNDNLSEQLTSLHATVGVAICALAAVRNHADACNRMFNDCHQSDIEPALIKALINQPQCLDDAAAELAMQQGDDSATALLRRHLNNLMGDESND